MPVITRTRRLKFRNDRRPVGRRSQTPGKTGTRAANSGRTATTSTRPQGSASTAIDLKPTFGRDVRKLFNKVIPVQWRLLAINVLGFEVSLTYKRRYLQLKKLVYRNKKIRGLVQAKWDADLLLGATTAQLDIDFKINLSNLASSTLKLDFSSGLKIIDPLVNLLLNAVENVFEFGFDVLDDIIEFVEDTLNIDIPIA